MEARRSLYLAALVAMPLLGVLLLQNTARTATGSTTVVRMVSAAKHANSYQEEASGNLTAHMQHLYQLSFGKYGAWRRVSVELQL